MWGLNHSRPFPRVRKICRLGFLAVASPGFQKVLRHGCSAFVSARELRKIGTLLTVDIVATYTQGADAAGILGHYGHAVTN